MADSNTRNERAAARRVFESPGPDGSMRYWRMAPLWASAAGLPVKKVRLRDLTCLDEVCWFSEPMKKLPTCRAVAEHARDIYEADFSYPIILSPSGDVLDGMHRICKAHLQGMEEIDAVQLTSLPEPCGRALPNGEDAKP